MWRWAEGSECLWSALGCAAVEHRTDSLSLHSRTWSESAQDDLTDGRMRCVNHLRLTPSRQHQRCGHENGAIEALTAI